MEGMKLTLEVLISTLGAEGIRRVCAMKLPELSGVTYLVSWQRSDGVDIPSELASRRDVRVMRNPGIGLSQNRNYAFDHAVGDVLLIADDDLSYEKDGLQAVADAFIRYPELDMAMFRYKNEAGLYEKKYAKAETSLKDSIPAGYYATSFEIAVRREGKSGSLRFSEHLGLGAPVLHCGEEEVFLQTARRRHHDIRLFPVDLCVHAGPTTGLRLVEDPGVYRGMGAATFFWKPFSCLPRFVLMAWRGHRRGQMKFFPALYNFVYGAAYMCFKLKSLKRDTGL